MNPTWEYPVWDSDYEGLGSENQQGEAPISAPISGPITFVLGQIFETTWGVPWTLTGFALSMAVNTLVTGLIVFKILKVFLEVKAASTSVERTLGATGSTKLRHVIFVIIESGMALFAIQLVRVVLYLQSAAGPNAYNLVIGINEMFNVIIGSVHFLPFFYSFADNIYLSRASHQQ